MLRQDTDQAFLTSFGHLSQALESWTSSPTTITDAITIATTGSESHLPGTAIYDAVFHACYSQFGGIDHTSTGNVILLFTDGEDNASYTTLQAAVDMCQRSNTAIYAFRDDDPTATGSSGPATLAALTAQTGGRVFRDDESDAAINEELRAIDSTLRNQYRLVYRPAALKHDGAFHKLTLIPPKRAETVTIRSGYYAPKH